jgi:hypothetical protein
MQSRSLDLAVADADATPVLAADPDRDRQIGHQLAGVALVALE